jgi:hypothetical protein
MASSKHVRREESVRMNVNLQVGGAQYGRAVAAGPAQDDERVESGSPDMAFLKSYTYIPAARQSV